MNLSTPNLGHLIPRQLVLGLGLASLALGLGCGDGGGDSASSPAVTPAPAAAQPAAEAPQTSKKKTMPDDLEIGLVLGLSAFPESTPGDTSAPTPLPAELEFIVRRGGEWVVTRMTDPASNVFHKALTYETPDGETALLTGGGEKALLKLWKLEGGKLVSQTLWEKNFGGRFSRMRDIEVGDIDGNGTNVIAVATHDQGVVAVVRPKDGGYEVEELDVEKDTFVHEVELGDVDGDGAMEIYATPSEPNRLDGSHQSGQVVRYVPSKGEGRVVVALPRVAIAPRPAMAERGWLRGAAEQRVMHSAPRHVHVRVLKAMGILATQRTLARHHLAGWSLQLERVAPRWRDRPRRHEHSTLRGGGGGGELVVGVGGICFERLD